MINLRKKKKKPNKPLCTALVFTPHVNATESLQSLLSTFHTLCHQVRFCKVVLLHSTKED